MSGASGLRPRWASLYDAPSGSSPRHRRTGRGVPRHGKEDGTTSTTGFDLIADGIDAILDHLHKKRWTERAAELHAKADFAEGEVGDQARRALRGHYADRFRPETSRMALLDQAAANYAERQEIVKWP